MGVYIKNWSLADWKELLKWAKIGANNAMIGEFTEVEEVPPHGDLIDKDANLMSLRKVLFSPFAEHGTIETAMLKACIKVFEEAPTIIPAEEGKT